MTTDQLYRARIALHELFDIVQHLDSDPPEDVHRSLDRLDAWLERGRIPAAARREYNRG